MNRCYFLIVPLFCCQTLWSQADSSEHKWEIGLNVSYVLANVFNVGIDRALLDDYSLVIKRRAGKRSFWRLHVGGEASSDEVAFSALSVSSYQLHGKLGFEFRKSIAARFDLLYGIDLVARTTSEKSEFFGALTTRTDENALSLGVSGFLGFGYEVTDRIFLTTETALFGMVEQVTTDVTESVSTQRVDQRTNYFAQHSLPISLYLYVRL